MFTKKVPIDRGSVNIRHIQYKKVVDGEAVAAALVLGFLFLAFLGWVTGG